MQHPLMQHPMRHCSCKLARGCSGRQQNQWYDLDLFLGRCQTQYMCTSASTQYLLGQLLAWTLLRGVAHWLHLQVLC